MKDNTLRRIAAVIVSLYLALFITACGKNTDEEPSQYTITASAESNGTISPTGAVTADKGSARIFTITPDAGYIVLDVQVDAKSVGAVTSYSFNSITSDHTIEASFTNEPRTITATAEANGSISPPGNVSVDNGTDQTFTIIPDGNYYVSDVLVDGVSAGAVTSYTFANVTTDHTIEASFATGPRTITATAGANGSIAPSGNVSVDAGTDQTFTITPDTGYYVSDVLVDGVSVGAVASHTFANVTTDHTIEASFDAAPLNITATAGANGSISPSGNVSVDAGTDQIFTVTPDTDYYVSDVLVDGVSVGAVTGYTFTNVTAAHTIEAIFATGPRTISATAGANGSISPAGDVSVDAGTDQKFTIIPDGNYYVSDVLVDEVSVGAVTSYTFVNVTTDHTIEVSFATNTITATAIGNGSITPSGSIVVTNGASQTFTITPDTNHHISDVLVDGVSVGAVPSYTFVDVTFDHTIDASFAADHIFVTIGDSITEGTGDDYSLDDTSQDGRNTGGGFQPILNDLLTDYENGIAHNIINEGVAGDTSFDGLAKLQSILILNTYPDARSYLVMFGTNDARPFGPPVPSGLGLPPGHPNYPGTFKDNMQQIIDLIKGEFKEVILAKPPITLGDGVNSEPYPDPDTGARSVLIKEYNQVIDQLRSDNNITVPAPDFYNHFKADPGTGNPRYVDQYADNLHPNGIGYQSMAEVWFDTLTQ